MRKGLSFNLCVALPSARIPNFKVKGSVQFGGSGVRDQGFNLVTSYKEKPRQEETADQEKEELVRYLN
jgi:uncharacterized protein YneR